MMSTMGGDEAFRLFYDADRRLRGRGAPARSALDRSRALEIMGFEDAAAEDLRQAEEGGLRDLDVLRWFAEHHPDPEKRRTAAWVAIRDQRFGEAFRSRCVTTLLSAGEKLVGDAFRRGPLVEVWMAWDSGADVAVEIALDSRLLSPEHIDPRQVRSYPGEIRSLAFSFAADLDAAVEVRPSLDGVPLRALTVPPALRAACPDLSRAGASLSVVVPVYGDAASLAACLEALRSQAVDDVAYVLVDDASPDPAVATLAEMFARDTGGTYRGRRVNGGFAAAVNDGLDLCSDGDVLILNSDVVLPPGALRRLRAAAASEPHIGTLSPLSNDAGCVSFPRPPRGSAAPSPTAMATLDAAAAEVNAGRVVDVLAPHGSCLYVTRACRKRVGGLSLAYGRGYYEDIELCLRADKLGLRNVAACDLFVSHLGGRSFGAEKRALVDRNHAIICRRFPEYEARDALFDRADPLRPFRGAIEERLGFAGAAPVVLVARAGGGETLVRARRLAWDRQGRGVLVLRWTLGPRHTVVSVTGEDGPHALDFTLDEGGAARFATYLVRSGTALIEVVEPERTPHSVLTILTAMERPLHLLVDSLASAAFTTAPDPATPGARAQTTIEHGGRGRGAHPRAFDRATPALALDRMASAALGLDGEALVPHHVEPSTRTGYARSGAGEGAPPSSILGVLLPEACPAAELLVLALARDLRKLRRPTRIVVLGPSIAAAQLMSPGNVWVTGPLGDDDPAEVVAHHAVERLVSPYRTEMFWHIEAVAQSSGRPKAYFDWSPGGVAAEPGDLALPHGIDDANAAALIAHWCGGADSAQASQP